MRVTGFSLRNGGPIEMAGKWDRIEGASWQ
jgi:hypothetical protein